MKNNWWIKVHNGITDYHCGSCNAICDDDAKVYTQNRTDDRFVIEGIFCKKCEMEKNK